MAGSPWSSTPFRFGISVRPTSGSVQRGQSIQATVTVSLISGTPGTVTLSAHEVPLGCTVSFAPASGLPTFTSTVTFSTSATARLGTFRITLRGERSPALFRLTFYTLTITPPPPRTRTFWAQFPIGMRSWLTKSEEIALVVGFMHVEMVEYLESILWCQRLPPPGRVWHPHYQPMLIYRPLESWLAFYLLTSSGQVVTKTCPFWEGGWLPSEYQVVAETHDPRRQFVLISTLRNHKVACPLGVFEVPEGILLIYYNVFEVPHSPGGAMFFPLPQEPDYAYEHDVAFHLPRSRELWLFSFPTGEAKRIYSSQGLGRFWYWQRYDMLGFTKAGYSLVACYVDGDQQLLRVYPDITLLDYEEMRYHHRPWREIARQCRDTACFSLWPASETTGDIYGTGITTRASVYLSLDYKLAREGLDHFLSFPQWQENGFFGRHDAARHDCQVSRWNNEEGIFVPMPLAVSNVSPVPPWRWQSFMSAEFHNSYNSVHQQRARYWDARSSPYRCAGHPPCSPFSFLDMGDGAFRLFTQKWEEDPSRSSIILRPAMYKQRSSLPYEEVCSLPVPKPGTSGKRPEDWR